MAISFNHIPSGIRVPLFWAEVDASMANTSSNNLKTLLIGQMLASGVAEANKPVLVTGDSQGKELFGRGSILARMNSAYRKNDTYGEVWAIPISDPESSTKASCSVTVSGKATAAGSVYLYVGAERITVNVAIDDTASAIAKALEAAINAKLDLPVTASAADSDSNGIVTLEAKNGGVLGNDIRVALNINGYASGEVFPEGITVTATEMTGGAGTPEFEAVIKAMGDEECDFVALPYCDTTTLNTFQEVMNDKTGRWSPTQQLYGHVYSAMRGSVSDLQAFGSLRNDQHMTIVGVEETAASLVYEYLGAFVAQCAAAITIDPARPLQTLEMIGVTGAPEGERFTLSEKQTLLTSGIATTYFGGGYVRIERAITTYQRNDLEDEDTSYLDSETLHTLAYILRDLKSIITTKYPRHKLAADGTRYGPGQAIVTPSVIRGELIAQYSKLEEKGIVENADLFAEHLIVERDVDDPSRLNVLLPPDLVNGLRIFAVLAQFRLNY